MGRWYLEIAAAQCAFERQYDNSTVANVDGNPASAAEIRDDQSVVMPAGSGLLVASHFTAIAVTPCPLLVLHHALYFYCKGQSTLASICLGAA